MRVELVACTWDLMYGRLSCRMRVGLVLCAWDLVYARGTVMALMLRYYSVTSKKTSTKTDRQI